MKTRILVFCLLLHLFSCLTVQAGMRWERFKNWIDSADVKGADPSYVYLPQEGFLGTFNLNEVGSHLRITHNSHSLPGLDRELSGSLTSRITTLSLGIHYRGWGLSYSRDMTDVGDYEFTYSSYGQTYGLEFRVTRSNSLAGKLSDVSSSKADETLFTFVEGSVHQRSLILNGYYVFNHDQFSLPAAMSHTVIQRRSAGSWLASVNLHYSRIRVYEDPVSPLIGFNYLSLTQCSIGGGYAYNLVFGKEHFLLHGSLMPMIIFLHRNRYYYGDDGERSYPGQRLSINASSHLSFVYNVSRYVTGFSSIYNFDSMRADRGFSLYTTDWMVNMFVGVRF